MAMSSAAIGSWAAHAVPLDETTGVPPTRTSTPRSHDSRTVRRIPSGYISDGGDTSGSRRPSMRSASATATRKRSTNALREKRSDTMIAKKNVESAWIHRDKLAQIEIQEMEEAGIYVPRSRRSLSVGADGRDSRSMDRARGAQSAMSTDHYDAMAGEEQYGSAGVTSPDGSTRKRVSTIPAADEDEQAYYEQHMGSGVHTPEEQTSEQSYRGHHSRPSGSKIPLSKTSPAPVPQDMVDRESPLTHSRNGSSSLDEMQFARRARSNSIGSQVLLDDADGMDSSHPARSPTDSSPNKSRTPKGTAPTGRKTSNTGANRRPSSSQKNKAVTSPKSRQASASNGHKSRPSTSHKPPEGEAPWIATMYKPDPRLPPDQQMLPTHAKRLMQEQWEKEGKAGTTYDRELRLMNDDDFQESQNNEQAAAASPGRDAATDKSHTNPADSPTSPAWPLTPPMESRSDTALSARPNTSGGYKITPTIVSPPVGARHTTPSPNGQMAMPSPHRHPPSRMSDLTEKDEPTPKKLLCCIIM